LVDLRLRTSKKAQEEGQADVLASLLQRLDYIVKGLRSINYHAEQVSVDPARDSNVASDPTADLTVRDAEITGKWALPSISVQSPPSVGQEFAH
jgi:hypothetical protein